MNDVSIHPADLNGEPYTSCEHKKLAIRPHHKYARSQESTIYCQECGQWVDTRAAFLAFFAYGIDHIEY